MLVFCVIGCETCERDLDYFLPRSARVKFVGRDTTPEEVYQQANPAEHMVLVGCAQDLYGSKDSFKRSLLFLIQHRKATGSGFEVIRHHQEDPQNPFKVWAEYNVYWGEDWSLLDQAL